MCAIEKPCYGSQACAVSSLMVPADAKPSSPSVSRSCGSALPLLSPECPCERREIVVETAYGGPGARDAFELVTRAVTGERYRVNPGLARPERAARWSASSSGSPTGIVVLARTEERTVDQEVRLDELKREMADRVMSRPASEGVRRR